MANWETRETSRVTARPADLDVNGQEDQATWDQSAKHRSSGLREKAKVATTGESVPPDKGKTAGIPSGIPGYLTETFFFLLPEF